MRGMPRLSDQQHPKSVVEIGRQVVEVVWVCFVREPISEHDDQALGCRWPRRSSRPHLVDERAQAVGNVGALVEREALKNLLPLRRVEGVTKVEEQLLVPMAPPEPHSEAHLKLAHHLHEHHQRLQHSLLLRAHRPRVVDTDEKLELVRLCCLLLEGNNVLADVPQNQVDELGHRDAVHQALVSPLLRSLFAHPSLYRIRHKRCLSSCSRIAAAVRRPLLRVTRSPCALDMTTGAPPARSMLAGSASSAPAASAWGWCMPPSSAARLVRSDRDAAPLLQVRTA
eukprot:3934909-Rhodomonas_salina.4